MGYYDDTKNAEGYAKMCEGYDAAAHLPMLFDAVPQGARLLELGAGPGADAALLHERYKVTATDAAQPFVDMIKRRLPGVDVRLMNAVSMDIDETYDAVYSNKLFQHLTDAQVQASFKRQADVLVPGGIAYHMIWTSIDNPPENMGLNFIARCLDDMRPLMGDAFEVMATEAYGEFEDGDSLIIMARRR